MRMISAAVLALTLSVSQSMATDAKAPVTAPLSAGKPAGVKAAQFENIPWTAFLAVAVVGIGIGFAASQPGNQGVTTATSTSP